MHREDITHVVVSKTDFVITASSDGVLMFWSKKLEGGIEFVKTFRSHLKPVVDMVGSADGQLLATASEDQTVKFYDIVNFDMFLMLKLDFTPGVCEWLHKVGSPTPTIAVADANGPLIRIYGTGGSNVPLHTIDLHSYGVTSIVRNPKFDVVISTDEKGMVEFWSANDYKYPKILKFTSKIKTDLYDFVKCQAVPWGVAFSPNGQLFAAMASDRKVRIFKVATGKLHKVYDESLEKLLEQSEKSAFDAMELGRRKAGEMELLRSGSLRHENCVFDESSNFVIYPTMVGIKVVNILTNVVSRIIGKGENMRCLQLTLYQGIPKKKDAAATTLLQETADNPGLRATDEDPTLFSTGFKKSRFYMFTRREPDESVTQDIGRDVFNLKPTREEQLAATGVLAQRKLAEQVTMHTSMGDVTIDLFLHECPKTVENFVTHCRDGYFNGIIFHRVIDRFMVQTGDPDGNGTGGESIWGTEFEDEFHPTLKHDRPYVMTTLSPFPPAISPSSRHIRGQCTKRETPPPSERALPPSLPPSLPRGGRTLHGIQVLLTTACYTDNMP